MANEFKVRKGLIVQGSGSTLLDIQGSQGQLFSVTDSLSGSLFSVNDISGMPIVEVFSDDRVLLGTFNAEAIKVSGSTASVTGSLFGTSSFAISSSRAVTSSFAVTSSNALTASNITPAINGNVNNRVLTADGDGTLTGEANLTFDGALLYANSSFIQGGATSADGVESHAEGNKTIAIGNYSHAEGDSTVAIGDQSHAEGEGTKTGTQYAFYSNGITSGVITLSSYGDISALFVAGNPLIYSDVGYDETYGITTFTIDSVTWDGTNTIVTLTDTSVNGSEAVCGDLRQINNWASSGGDRNINANFSHAEGRDTSTFGFYSHAEGRYSIASGQYSHAEGYETIASGEASHAEGYRTVTEGSYSHAEGYRTVTSGSYSHAEGYETVSIGEISHAEGRNTAAIGRGSHAEGNTTIASGSYSHAEGQQTTASGSYSHAEGLFSISSESWSHAEGRETQAQGMYSHTEGRGTVAKGEGAHAEGFNTIALGLYSHAEGEGTATEGIGSHAEGRGTVASGSYSHAEGLGTVSSGSYQHTQGQYNISSSAQSAFIIGNGTSDVNRSNLVFASGSTFQVTGSLMVKDILQLAVRTTTPTTALTGSIMISGSAGTIGMYVYTGEGVGGWARVSLT